MQGPVLTRARSVDEFLAAPSGRFVTGANWLVFHERRQVAGLAMWGSPTPRDLLPLLKIFSSFDSPLGERLPRYFDARRLLAAQQPVIAQLLEFVQAHHVRLARLFTAIGFVHHGGVGRAITEGIRLLSRLPFSWAAFTEPVAALQWLQCPRAVQLGAEVDALIASAAGGSILAHDVRAFCAAHVGTARVEGAARALLLSTRSLQRKLADQGTSFQDLLQEVRVTRAKQLLSTTRLSVGAVAGEVGCAARHFSALFRKATRLSPTQWRAIQSGSS